MAGHMKKNVLMVFFSLMVSQGLLFSESLPLTLEALWQANGNNGEVSLTVDPSADSHVTVACYHPLSVDFVWQSGFYTETVKNLPDNDLFNQLSAEEKLALRQKTVIFTGALSQNELREFLLTLRSRGEAAAKLFVVVESLNGGDLVAQSLTIEGAINE